MGVFSPGTDGIKPRVQTIARIVVWFCALEVLWAVFVGTTQSTELIAGLIASAITVVFVEVLRSHDLLEFSPSLRVVGRAWVIPGHVLYDFVLVFWVLLRELAHGRRVRGQWVEIEYPVAEGPKGRFHRALTVALENETANAIVVDLDRDRALLHALVPGVKTGHEAL